MLHRNKVSYKRMFLFELFRIKMIIFFKKQVLENEIVSWTHTILIIIKIWVTSYIYNKFKSTVNFSWYILQIVLLELLVNSFDIGWWNPPGFIYTWTYMARVLERKFKYIDHLFNLYISLSRSLVLFLGTKESIVWTISKNFRVQLAYFLVFLQGSSVAFQLN